MLDDLWLGFSFHDALSFPFFKSLNHFIVKQVLEAIDRVKEREKTDDNQDD